MTRSEDTSPRVQGFFHGPTNTITYLVSDPATGAAGLEPGLHIGGVQGGEDGGHGQDPFSNSGGQKIAARVAMT